MGIKRYIKVGKFIDGTGAALRRNIFLGVQDGVIIDIGPVSDIPSNDPAVIDDLSDCIIVPAFVDCAVSLSRSPSVDRRVQVVAESATLAEKTALMEKHISYCFSHGVLGVAESCDRSDLVKQYREEMTEASMVDFKISNHFSANGHNGVADSPGYDFTRIIYSASIDDVETTHSQMESEHLRRILQQTERKTVVVANGVQQVRDALAAGCDAIEQGYFMGEENLKQMASQGVVWIPSVLRAKNGLANAENGAEVNHSFCQLVAPGKAVLPADKFWEAMLAEQLIQLRLARDLGVTTLIGTGAGSPGILHGESVVEEMKFFTKAGFSLAETVQCASGNGAQLFGMENLGALTVGRKATFLVTRGIVTQLPRKFVYLDDIWVDGVSSAAYRKNPIKVVS